MKSIQTKPWYQSALSLVEKRHLGKRDQLDRPYEQHFVRVAQRLIELFPDATREQIQAALLHDAFEPGTEVSVEEMREHGVSEEAMRIIKAITLPTDGRSYLQYIEDLCVSRDFPALEVKLADNADALDLLGALDTAETRELLDVQYRPSRQMLQNALART